MKLRYGTFECKSEPWKESGGPTIYGVMDFEGDMQVFETVDAETSRKIVGLLNKPADCRFNCRAKREADYLQGWIDRDRECPIPEAGKRCAKRYVETGSGKDTSVIVG